MKEFIENDIESRRVEILEYLENATGEPLFPGDERRIFAEALIGGVFPMVTASLNEGLRQGYLRYATGENLDLIGENRGCTRTPADYSLTTLRYWTDEPKGWNIQIPKGSRVTSDRSLFFETVATAVLPAGETEVLVDAIATVAGSDHNGILPGKINAIASLVPGIEHVENITTTWHGQDEEDDEHFRERIRQYPNVTSTAGPAKAYRAYAIEAHPDVVDALVLQGEEEVEVTLPSYGGYCFFPADRVEKCSHAFEIENEMMKIQSGEDLTVSITRNLKGIVMIYPICKGGVLPSEDILQQVYEECAKTDRRPLTDTVIVRSPEAVPYDIELKYWTRADIEGQVIENVEGEEGAIAQYIRWQDENLNQDINPDHLRMLMLCPDWDPDRNAPYRVEIIKPTYTELRQTEIAKFSGSLIVSHEVIYG